MFGLFMVTAVTDLVSHIAFIAFDVFLRSCARMSAGGVICHTDDRLAVVCSLLPGQELDPRAVAAAAAGALHLHPCLGNGRGE